MTRPNPLWGIHATAGAIVGSLVRRRDDGSYEVLEHLDAPASEDEMQSLADAIQVLDRRGVRGRAALLAVPDTEGCYTTAEIPDDELYLNEDELFRELYEYTPFEPEDGVIVYRRLEAEADRKYAVCALPVGHMNTLMVELAALDPTYHGIGLTSASLVRAAHTLGLVGDHGFLLDVQMRMSVLYAIDGEDCNRYLIPVGVADIRKDPVAASALARDVLQQASYHLEQHLGADGHDILDPQKDIVLVGPHTDADLRHRVAAIFVDRLAPPDWRPGDAAPITGPDGAELDGERVLRSAAAIGAAIEAFQDGADRLVLRQPPDEVPEYAEEGRPWWHWAAAAALVLALGAAGLQILGGSDTSDPPDVATTDPFAIDRAAALEHAALRSAYAQVVESLLEVLAATPPHLSATRVEISADGLSYDVVLTLWGEPRMADVAALGTIVAELPEASDSGVELQDELLVVHFSASARGRAPEDGPEVARAPLRSRAPTGVLVVRQRLAGIGLLEPASEDAPDEITTRLRAEASLEALAALGFPVDSPPPAAVTLDVDGDDTVLTARMGGPSVGSAPLSEAEAGYLRRAAGRAEAIGSLEFARAARTFGSAEETQPAFEVAATAAGRVRISYGAGGAGRELQRSAAGTDAWETVKALGAEPGECTDDVAGPGGDYVWRVREADRTVAESGPVSVPVPVEIELIGAGDGATDGAAKARFRLSRAWRGETTAVTADLGVGEAVTAETALPGERRRLSFRTPWRVTAVRTRTITEKVTVRVPRLLPDGRVERDPAGEPVLEERRVERAQPHLEVEAEAPDRPTRTWVRKMTDG